MAVDMNRADLVKKIPRKEILDKRVKRLVQACLENPELNIHVLIKFFNRDVKWAIINQYIYHGKQVKCELCKEESFSGFWCNLCIHTDWCCYCCILLGFFRYG